MLIKRMAGTTLLLVVLLAIGCAQEPMETPEQEPDLPAEPVKWAEYQNERFAFTLSYPVDWMIDEAQNGDGIVLKTGDRDQRVRAFGNELSTDRSRSFSLGEIPDLTEGTTEIASGTEARTLSGSTGERHYLEVMVLEDERAVHLVFDLTESFYTTHREIVERMVADLSLDEREARQDHLTREQAVEIQSSFYALLFDPTLKEGSYEVVGFSSKEDLEKEALEYAEEALIEDYLDEYYREEDGNLFVVPTEGPARLSTQEPIERENIDANTVRFTQEAENALWGSYRLEIIFRKTEEIWRISEQTMELLDTKGD